MHDVIVAAAAVVVSLYLRVGNDMLYAYREALLFGLPTFVVIAGTVFYGSGSYRGIWRYCSLPDLLAIGRAATLAVLIFMPVMFLINRLADVPRSVPFILWFVLIFGLGSSRLAYRLYRTGKLGAASDGGASCAQVPVLVAGACDAAAMFIRAMNGSADAPYRVVGILDDDQIHSGRLLHGVPIVGGTGNLGSVLDQLAARRTYPQRIVVADPSAQYKGEKLRVLLAEAGSRGLSIVRLPSLLDFKQAIEQKRLELKPIALEDLLGRPQAVLNRTAITSMVSGRSVLITGAGGSIGSELTRQIASLGPGSLGLLDCSEFNLYSIEMEIAEAFPDLAVQALLCDIRDPEHVRAIFADQRPELVFHAAALKHVPMVERNPCEGVLTNVIGTAHVAEAARDAGVRAMVQISTDKAVNPTSAMGASKRLAEFYCQALDLAALSHGDGGASPRFMTVRFGNVLGSSGSVIPLFQRQLARGGPLTVTHPQIERYFMTVREAVELVLQASANGVADAGRRGEIFVLDMGQPVKIADVARQMTRLAGLRPDTDVAIEYVGLRPGEKLYEELFGPEERRLTAAVDGVLVAASRPIGLEVLRPLLRDLESACRRRDAGLVRTLMAAVVPVAPSLRSGEEHDAAASSDTPESGVDTSVSITSFASARRRAGEMAAAVRALQSP